MALKLLQKKKSSRRENYPDPMPAALPMIIYPNQSQHDPGTVAGNRWIQGGMREKQMISMENKEKKICNRFPACVCQYLIEESISTVIWEKINRFGEIYQIVRRILV